MKSIFTAIVLATFLLVNTGTGAFAAKSMECTVKSVNDTVITLDCGKKTDKLDVGATVTLRKLKKKAIEGC